PHIRFLFVRPALCFGLPPDDRSPASPLPPANSSPCRVSRGLSPPSRCALPGAPKKERDPKAPLDRATNRGMRSETLLVADVRGTPIRGVQVHVERTAIVADQLRHFVGEVFHTQRDGRIPRQVIAALDVV